MTSEAGEYEMPSPTTRPEDDPYSVGREAAALLAPLSELDAALVELASPEFMRNYQAMKARLEAADDTITRIAVVNRIEPLPPVVMELIAQYHNPAPAAEGE